MKHYIYASAVLVIGSLWFLYNVPAQGSTVSVTATIATSLSCNTNISSTSFGTLTTSAVTTANPNATTTIATNDPLGITLSVSDSNGGLATTTPAYTIHSASSTLVAGTEGYGINALSNGGGVSVSSAFNKTGNAVGGLATSTQTLASSASTVLNATISVAHLAAISTSTPAGNYSDTITYSCNGN